MTERKEHPLQGQVAVVTGGASGIGKAIAEELAANGARIAIIDLDQQAAESTAAQLGEQRARGYRADVASASSVQEAVARIAADHGRIDILVNSAGVGVIKPVFELTEADWDFTVDINMKGMFLVCQAVGKLMVEAGYGRVINIASKCGSIAIEEHAAYSASKFGVIGLSKVLALEWAPHNITVNTLSPTVVLTELGKKAWFGEKAEAMLSTIPVGKFATPEDIAHAALFLATDSGMVTGADLLIDGGYTIR